MNNISKTISDLTLGSQEEINQILYSLEKKKLKKGDFLLKQDRPCTRYYFVENGSIRLYYIKDDNDYTVWIGTNGEIFTNLESYLDGSPSRINIVAIEPSTVYVIDKINSEQLAQKNHTYNTLLRKTVEIAFVGLSKNVISFQSDEAKERYNRLTKEKNWIQKYPLKYISTFIGVTQSTLSRIRSKQE